MVMIWAQAVHAQSSSLFSRTYHPSFPSSSLLNFLQDINRQTGVVIEYVTDNLDTTRQITLQGKPITIGTVLQQVLKGEKIRAVEKNNKIMLTPANDPLPDDFFLAHYSLYGMVKEAVSGEPLPEATIWQPDRKRGSLSNNFGYYTLIVPEGRQVIQLSYAGYNTQTLVLNITADTRLDISFQPQSDIQEVTVTSPAHNNEQHTDEALSAGSAASNVVMGETDIMRTLYQLPGVKNVPEINSGLLVRGGGQDQNVFLLDGNTIFNPTHLLGMLSIVNQTSVKSLNLYKSDFPARYGGGLSSVVDVLTKDGNMQKWKGEANVGPLSGSFTIEGPLKKDRMAIMLSARQTWVNPLLRLMQSNLGINFYDLHMKVTQLIGQKDKLMLNVYAGHDKMNLHQDYTNNKQQWGNKALSLGWNHLLNKKAFLSTTLNYSQYNNIAGFSYNLYDTTGINILNRVYNTYSSIEQYNVRTQLEVSLNNKVKLNVGGKFGHTSIRPFSSNISDDFVDNPADFAEFPSLNFREIVGFAEAEWRPNADWLLRPGLHVSHFINGDFHRTSWQPRFYAQYRISKRQRLEFSYSHMTQYLHLVTNPYLGINSDAWVPSTDLLRPEESDMVNFGYRYRQGQQWSFGAAVYYKWLRNVTNYADGKNLFLSNANWESDLQSGKGWSYGIEWQADRRTDKWQWHLAYTLSWNWRKFSTINNGFKFPFKYDRRHDLNISSTYFLNKTWSFTAQWFFATGDVYTLPNQGYPDFDNGQQITDPLQPGEYRLIYYSSAVNQYRTLPYHRLDVAATYRCLLFRKLSSRFTAGVYNIYGSPNQYVYDLEGTMGKRSLIVTTRYQRFSVTPYIACTVSF
jgi:hypothetical protein